MNDIVDWNAFPLRRVLIDCGFLEAASPSVLDYDGYRVVLDSAISRRGLRWVPQLSINWGGNGEAVSLKIEDNTAMAEAEAAIRAIVDPRRATTLMGIGWTRGLMEKLLSSDG